MKKTIDRIAREILRLERWKGGGATASTFTIWLSGR